MILPCYIDNHTTKKPENLGIKYFIKTLHQDILNKA